MLIFRAGPGLPSGSRPHQRRIPRWKGARIKKREKHPLKSATKLWTRGWVAEFFAPCRIGGCFTFLQRKQGKGNGLPIARGRNYWTHLMKTVYDFVTVICFICMAVTYFINLRRAENPSPIAFMLPFAAAFAIANQVGNLALAGNNLSLNILAVVLIIAGVGYTFIIVRHTPA